MFKLLILNSILILINFSTIAFEVGSVTGFEIPRFVSLKSNDVNLRIGSSTNYPIILKYNTKNLPIKVIKEYENWRKIKDIDGNEGWIHKNLIQGERYGIININIKPSIKVYTKPEGKEIGEIGKRNIVKINVCLENWCKIKFKNYKGWIKKEYLWGIFSEENINIPFYQSIINFIWKFNF